MKTNDCAASPLPFTSAPKRTIAHHFRQFYGAHHPPIGGYVILFRLSSHASNATVPSTFTRPIHNGQRTTDNGQTIHIPNNAEGQDLFPENILPPRTQGYAEAGPPSALGSLAFAPRSLRVLCGETRRLRIHWPRIAR